VRGRRGDGEIRGEGDWRTEFVSAPKYRVKAGCFAKTPEGKNKMRVKKERGKRMSDIKQTIIFYI
jgi:hypothetical protein